MSDVAVIVSIVSAVGAVASAIIAAGSASRTRRLELERARLRALEERVGDSREELYVSFIEMLRHVLLQGKLGGSDEEVAPEDMVHTFSRFTTWLQVYGSDDAVRTMHKFQQAAYSEAPPEVMIRYYAEMMLAARRDLGDERTTVDLVDLMGLSLTDLYPEYQEVFGLSEEDLLTRSAWDPPWRQGNRSPRNRQILSSGGLDLLLRGRARHTWSLREPRYGAFSSGGFDLVTKRWG